MSRLRPKKKKALSILEELELDASRELHGFRYDRNLLNEIRLGRGKSYKELKEVMEADKSKFRRFMLQQETEKDLAHLKASMMWVKDAQSKVKAVDCEVSRLTRFSDPLGQLEHRLATPPQKPPKGTMLPPLPAASSSQQTSRSSSRNGSQPPTVETAGSL
eukprot:RCo030667